MHKIFALRSPSRRVTHVCIATLAMSFVAFAATNTPAHAAGITVTTTADGGAGSLRDAITQANTNPGADVITVPAGTYTLSITGTGEDANATGDLDINSDITIIGAGSGSTIINANGIDRVFDLHSGASALQKLTIENGDVGSTSGGNIRVGSGASLTVSDSVITGGKALSGAGISASGPLTVERTELVSNSAIPIQGTGSTGSAISSGGKNSSLDLRDSLVANNTATGGNAALYMNGNGSVSNTTFTGNASTARTILVESFGSGADITVTFTHITVANNTTDGNLPGLGIAANLISPAALSMTIEGSLFMNNMVSGTSKNCAVENDGVITSGGHNLADDTSCTAFTQTGDLTNNSGTTVGALANNGGPTRTLALITGSSAIDAAGACAGTTPTDQRGFTRPAGSACDIGAYEFQAVDPATTTTTTTIAVTTTTAGSGAGVPTTLPPGPTTPDQVTLPSTGSNSGSGLLLALLFCAFGMLLIRTTRRSVR